MKVDIVSLDGKSQGSMELPKGVFGVEVRKDLLQRAILWQQARWRAGTAATKGRSDVECTGKKWGRQKGGGGARHGARSSNIFRGGGVVFGPNPRSFAFDMPKKVRALALKCALSSKVADKKFVVLDEAKAKTHKTKDLVSALSKLELDNALFIVDALDENFDKASRNIKHVRVLPTEGANVFDIMKADKLVVTKGAVEMLSSRIEGRANKEAN